MGIKAISLNAFDAADALPGGAAPLLADSGLPETPFVGLRPFESTESLLFFGRREQTAELLQLLDRTRFLAVVGSSGCGKSSLIRAGLIPKLKAGFIVGRSDRWRFVKMRPGDSPLANLAGLLLAAFGAEATPEQVEELVGEISVSGARAITKRLAAWMKEESANVLLLVDQFEEIFRFGSYDDDDAEAESAEAPSERERRRDEAAEFVSIMLELAAQEAVPVYVVMTMRSDFLGDCDAFYGLPQAMNRSQYLVPRLTRPQRLEAIESPIRLYGGEISTRLLDRVLNDVGEEPDQLPVMQHAMLRTWEKWAERRQGAVDLEHYEHEEVGTIKGALSNDAERALQGMSEEELLVARRMFQALTKTDARGRKLRRPAHLSELEEITGASRSTILSIVERFRGHNRSFLTVSEDRLNGDSLIDISHESLIRQWAKLGDWVKEEVRSREQYLRLANDAVLHYDPEGKKVEVWRDPALQLALGWWEERRPNEAWARRYHPAFELAENFLAKSHRARTEEERAAARAQQRKLQQLFVATVVLAVLLLGAIGGVVYALNARQNAEASAKEANAARTALEAQKKELTASLERELESAQRLRDKTERAEKAERDALDAQQEAEDANKLAQAAAATASSEKQKALDTLSRLKKTQEIADKRQRVDELRRQAGKAQRARKFERAHQTYLKAVEGYMGLQEIGGAAYTYAELGKMMLEQPASAQTAVAAGTTQTGANETTAQSGRERGDWVGSVLLANAPPETPFPRLGLTYTQTVGLRHYANAIKTYRQAKDLTASADALDQVGTFIEEDLEEDSEEVSEITQQERDRAIDASMCAALVDYKNASDGAEGQITMLTKIGERLIKRANEAGNTGGGEATPEQAQVTERRAPANPLSCKETDGLSYLEKAAGLYRELIERETPEQAKSLRQDFSRLLVRLAALHDSRNENAEALERFKEATRVDLEATTNVLLPPGVLGTYSAPRDSRYYELIARIYHDAGRPQEEADILHRIGTRYGSTRAIPSMGGNNPRLMSYYQTAIEYFKRASAIYERLETKEARKQLAVTQSSLGYIYTRLNKSDEALPPYRSALRLFEELEDKESQANLHLAIGQALEKLEQLQLARESYQKASALSAEDGYAKEEANTSLARLNALQQRPGVTPSATPAQSQSAPPEKELLEDTDLDADLEGNAPAEGNDAPEGDVDYKVEDGNRKLKVTVKNTKLSSSAKLYVVVGDWKRLIPVSDSGRGEIDLETEDKDEFPPLSVDMEIKVVDESGRVVVSGTVVDRTRMKVRR